MLISKIWIEQKFYDIRAQKKRIENSTDLKSLIGDKKKDTIILATTNSKFIIGL